ncbi:MAG: CHAT domain-containing protein [Polyangiaceae bacterium]|nr:CHAT domain-containing protein [Polyangiaceae bacterium]
MGVAARWVEIEIEHTAGVVRARARGSRDEVIEAHALGEDLKLDSLQGFASSVYGAAEGAKAFDKPLLERAQALHSAVLRDGIDELRARLQEGAPGPLLVRLRFAQPELKSCPWEALATPGESMGFWGASADMLPVRSVASAEAWQAREIRGSVKVLVIAPTGAATVDRVKAALRARIASGEVSWLDPIEGSATRVAPLFDRLRRDPSPHVIHFVGHGRVRDGTPELQLADTDEGETWVAAELLATQLKAHFRTSLRLVVLEACEGAQAAAFGSAAEILTERAADAVVAHLYPVRADVARDLSEEFYRALTGVHCTEGNAASALNEARRVILARHNASAEVFSAVLYLRGPTGVVFDFGNRNVAAPAVETAPAAATAVAAPVQPAALASLFRRPFSLLLGDRWRAEGASVSGFRRALHDSLSDLGVPPGLPMSALAQRFVLRRGAEALRIQFQNLFQSDARPPSAFCALARRLGPGVHTTLLRRPLLERALAEAQPNRMLFVVQPGDEATLVWQRAPGETWKYMSALPESFDLAEQIVILRLYRGYTPTDEFTPPLLTEDDYLHGLRELERTLPSALADEILGHLGYRPMFLLGLSLLNWHHRMLLHRLFGSRPLPRGSLVTVDPTDKERDLWEKGTSLPGKAPVQTVELATADLVALLEADTGPRT